MKLHNPIIFLVVALTLSTFANADHHNGAVDLVGSWNVVASSENGSRELTWTFKKKNGKLHGISVNQEDGDERTFDRMSVDEKKVTLEVKIESDGQTGKIIVEAEEKSPGKLSGEWRVVTEDGSEYAAGDIVAKKQVSFAGEWETVAELPDGETSESTLTLTGKNDGLKGKIDSESWSVELNKVSTEDERLRLHFEIEVDDTPLQITVKAKPEGNDKLVGEWVAKGEDGSDAAEGKWSATRKLALVGKWDVVASVPNSGDYNGTLTLMAKNGHYAGTSQSDDGEPRELKTVAVDGDAVEFTVPFESDGNTGTITIQAKIQDDGSLVGEWILTGGDDDTEYARESWKATRK